MIKHAIIKVPLYFDIAIERELDLVELGNHVIDGTKGGYYYKTTMKASASLNMQLDRSSDRFFHTPKQAHKAALDMLKDHVSRLYNEYQ